MRRSQLEVNEYISAIVMSDLQLGLLGIGIVAVLAVLAYNKWQEIRYRRRAERDFGSPLDDVLLQTENSKGDSEPARAGVDHAGIPRSQKFPSARIDPVFGTESAPVPEVATRPESDQHVLAEEFDFIVVVECAEEVEAGSIIEASAKAMTIGNPSKAVRWEGFREQIGAWEPLRANGRYANIRAGMQLVDRGGAASAGDLASFEASVQKVALALGAIPMAGSLAAAATRALELDRLCTEVDIQIALNVTPKQGVTFTGSKVRASADSAGLTLDPDGRFRRRIDGKEQYSLRSRDGAQIRENQESLVNGLTLELDVPRAPGGMDTFEEFRDCAVRLASELNGDITDDNGIPLTQAAFDSIIARVSEVHRTMEYHGLRAAGSAALRLFS